MEKNKKTIHYEDALKHVNDVKTFYLNIFVYVIFVAIGLLFKANLLEFVLNNTDNLDSRFLHWLHINLILVPIVWAIVLLFQGLYLFQFKLSIFEKWDEVKAFMNKENKGKGNHWK